MAFKHTITKTYNVTSCSNCPHYSNTMDGMTCNELERTRGAYGGLVITNRDLISPDCPFNH
jgi:hypothetical protein